MMSTLTGNHTGPRQLELPPNIPDVDSAGSYCTRYAVPSTSNSYGCSRCHLESERMPCGPRKRSSSSMRVRMRRSLSSLTSDRMWRPCMPGLSGSAMRARRSPLRRRCSLDGAAAATGTCRARRARTRSSRTAGAGRRGSGPPGVARCRRGGAGRRRRSRPPRPTSRRGGRRPGPSRRRSRRSA